MKSERGLRDSGDDDDSDADEGFCPKEFVSAFLPPIGTVFHLIGTFQDHEDSGFYDTTGETESNASQVTRPSSSATVPPSHEIHITSRHTIVENLHELTVPSITPVIDQPHLIAQVTNLITPTVAVIRVLTTEPPHNELPFPQPVTMIMKSYPQPDLSRPQYHPSHPLPSQLPATVEQAAYTRIMHAAQPDTSSDDDYPTCVPNFFGKWTYIPDASKYAGPEAVTIISPTTQFSVLLFEDLTAQGVDGVRLDVYASRYLNQATNGYALKEKIYTSALEGLRWLHARAHIAHRDLHVGNIMVLPKEEQVVFIDFGMAAVGKHVLRGYGGRLPKQRRRYVDAIKGWGRADERVLREIFDALVPGGEDSDHCEDD